MSILPLYRDAHLELQRSGGDLKRNVWNGESEVEQALPYQIFKEIFYFIF
jgi:hypothetical protein